VIGISKRSESCQGVPSRASVYRPLLDLVGGSILDWTPDRHIPPIWIRDRHASSGGRFGPHVGLDVGRSDILSPTIQSHIVGLGDNGRVCDCGVLIRDRLDPSNWRGGLSDGLEHPSGGCDGSHVRSHGNDVLARNIRHDVLSGEWSRDEMDLCDPSDRRAGFP